MSDSELTEGLHLAAPCLLQPLSHGLRRASSPFGEPFGLRQQKQTRGRTASPHLHNLSRSHAFGVFHMAQPYFTLR